MREQLSKAQLVLVPTPHVAMGSLQPLWSHSDGLWSCVWVRHPPRLQRSAAPAVCVFPEMCFVQVPLSQKLPSKLLAV